MTVLTGRDPAQFSLVGQASSWAPPYLATLTFDAVAGTTYQLALTAPADGRVLITTDADRASAGLYQGSSLGSLTRLAASPVDAARQLVAPVVAGATYYLTIESDARWPGTFSLDLLLLPDPQGTLAASIGEDGAFSIQGFGFPAVVRVLEMSTDLRAWVPVQTSAEGGVNFREPIERTVPHRFYRVVTRSGP
jgi:hypothetical protein